MGQSSIKRDIVSFSKGFITDVSPLNFPVDHTVDEWNYDILIDGTRRRRKGLTQDSGSPTVSVAWDDTKRNRSFKWAAANNDTSVNFTVIQFGKDLKFFLDEEDGSIGAEQSFSIDLVSYMTEGAVAADVQTQLLDIAASRGQLVVVGEYIEPISITYNPDTVNVTVSQINIRERDLYGIDDGVRDVVMPTTLSASHRYNLENQGWTKANIDQFFTDTGNYPSKNLVYGRGFRRTIVTGIAEADGTKEFSSDKLVAELFQDAPAPRGHFIFDPFDTTTLTTSSTSGSLYLQSTAVTLELIADGVYEMVITTNVAHGLSPSDSIFIVPSSTPQITYNDPIFGPSSISVSGSYVIGSTPAADQLVIQIFLGELFGDPDTNGYEVSTLELVTDDELIENPEGVDVDVRPSTCAFFAGRVWYGGINFGDLTTKLYFSQVVEKEAQYGKCYQVADPTDENISDLVATDGGTINIPEMGVCYRLVPYSSGLLVFSFNGVWFIGPGSAGYFAADSYSVRKISEIGVDGPASVVMVENFPHYWGRNSIYRIRQDPNTGFLVADNISIGRIDTFFNAVSNRAKQLVQGAYDPLLKKIYWLFPGDDVTSVNVNAGYDKILLYDVKYDAYLKFQVPRETVDDVDSDKFVITSLFAAKTPNPNNTDATIKFVGQGNTNSKFYVFAGDSPIDLGIAELEQDAYMITGFDTLASPANRKLPLFITVFNVKTETGYEEVGDDLVPVNESSTLMQTRFDWANHDNSGKWSPEQEVYRHARLYTPANVSDNFDNGELFVVTRNKVRGRGRALNIKFSAGQGKASHIAGWSTNYRMLTEP